MKKIWLIALLFNTTILFCLAGEFPAKNSSAAGKNFFSKTELKFYLQYDSAVKDGFSLKLPFGNIRFFENPKGQTYSVSLYTGNYLKLLPATVKYGMISPGGIISKLNTPSLYTSPSPFSIIPSETLSISSTEPGINTTPKDNSLVLNLGIKPENFIKKIQIDFFIKPETEEKPFTLSMHSVFQISRNNTLSFTAAAGQYSYKSNYDSSWFSKIPFYNSGKHWCSIVQAEWHNNWFTSLNSVNIYSQPFQQIKSTYKSENSLKLKKSSLNFSCFYNPYSDLLTSSKSISEQIQLNLSVQNKGIIPFNNSPLLSYHGTGIYYSLNPSTKENLIKLTRTDKLTGQNFNTQLTLNCTGSLFTSDTLQFLPESFTVKNSTSYYTKYIKPKLDLTLTFKPENSFKTWTNTQKLAASLNLFKPFPSTITYSVNFEEENTCIKEINQELIMTITPQWKSLKISGKLSFKI